MELTLKRWNQDGSTSGVWLVRQLPGVTIVWAGAKDWVILCQYRKGGQFAPHSEAWGEDWELSQETIQLINKTRGSHPTRKAALLALEAAMDSNPENNLGEILQ